MRTFLTFLMLASLAPIAPAQQTIPTARGLENDRNPDSDAVTAYRYYIRTGQQGAFTYTRFATVTPQPAPAVPGFWFADQPLPAGLYTVVATAVNATGESAYSDPVTFYVVMGVPGKPTMLRIRP